MEELKSKYAPYINTIVLHDDEVALLIDIIDLEEYGKGDYAFVLQNNNGKIYNSSIVIGIILLKGFIQNKDYDRLVKKWNLNNKNKAI